MPSTRLKWRDACLRELSVLCGEICDSFLTTEDTESTEFKAKSPSETGCSDDRVQLGYSFTNIKRHVIDFSNESTCGQAVVCIACVRLAKRGQLIWHATNSGKSGATRLARSTSESQKKIHAADAAKARSLRLQPGVSIWRESSGP